MGTVSAILDYQPHHCEAFGQSVFYVPEGVAALSEPAFCALQADKIVNDGVLGFHLLYDPKTGEADFQRVINTWKILLKYNKQGKRFIRLADLKPTTPEVFFLRSADPVWDRRLVNWEELKKAGMTCVGNVAALQREIETKASASTDVGPPIKRD